MKRPDGAVERAHGAVGRSQGATNRFNDAIRFPHGAMKTPRLHRLVRHPVSSAAQHRLENTNLCHPPLVFSHVRFIIDHIVTCTAIDRDEAIIKSRKDCYAVIPTV